MPARPECLRGHGESCRGHNEWLYRRRSGTLGIMTPDDLENRLAELPGVLSCTLNEDTVRLVLDSHADPRLLKARAQAVCAEMGETRPLIVSGGRASGISAAAAARRPAGAAASARRATPVSIAVASLFVLSAVALVPDEPGRSGRGPARQPSQSVALAPEPPPSIVASPVVPAVPAGPVSDAVDSALSRVPVPGGEVGGPSLLRPPTPQFAFRAVVANTGTLTRAVAAAPAATAQLLTSPLPPAPRPTSAGSLPLTPGRPTTPSGGTLVAPAPPPDPAPAPPPTPVPVSGRTPPPQMASDDPPEPTTSPGGHGRRGHKPADRDRRGDDRVASRHDPHSGASAPERKPEKPEKNDDPGREAKKPERGRDK